MHRTSRAFLWDKDLINNLLEDEVLLVLTELLIPESHALFCQVINFNEQTNYRRFPKRCNLILFPFAYHRAELLATGGWDQSGVGKHWRRYTSTFSTS